MRACFLIVALLVLPAFSYGEDRVSPTDQAKAAIAIAKAKENAKKVSADTACVSEKDLSTAMSRALKEDTSLVVFVGEKTCVGKSKPLMEKGLVTYKTDTYAGDNNKEPKSPRIVVLMKASPTSMFVHKTLKADAAVKEILEETKKSKTVSSTPSKTSTANADEEDNNVSFISTDFPEPEVIETPPIAVQPPKLNPECKDGICGPGAMFTVAPLGCKCGTGCPCMAMAGVNAVRFAAAFTGLNAGRPHLLGKVIHRVGSVREHRQHRIENRVARRGR